MKLKLLQILLGAFGSALTVLLTHFANVPADVALGAALSAGPIATATLGDALSSVLS